MRKTFFLFLIFVSCFCIDAFAEPFLNQWEWNHPVLFGKVKIIIKEEAIYNIKQIFNEQGKKIEEQLLNKGNIIYKTILNYNEKGNLAVIERYSSSGKLLVRDKAFYEKGVIKYMESTVEPKKGKFFFDEKGYLNEIAVFKSDGKRIGKYIYKFNKFGNLVEKQSLNALFELREKNIIFYDDKGLPSGELTYSVDGSLARKDIYRYKYDNKGNWIVKETESEVFIDGESSKLVPISEKRKLTYFNI